MSTSAPDYDHAAEAAGHLQDAANMHGQAQAVALALASVEANLATAQAVERLNDNMAELAQGLGLAFARFAEVLGPALVALAEAAEASRRPGILPDGSNL